MSHIPYCFAIILCVFTLLNVNAHFTLHRSSNLGFAHSSEGDKEYDDRSGTMGFSYNNDEGPVMVRRGRHYLVTLYFLRFLT